MDAVIVESSPDLSIFKLNASSLKFVCSSCKIYAGVANLVVAANTFIKSYAIWSRYIVDSEGYYPS